MSVQGGSFASLMTRAHLSTRFRSTSKTERKLKPLVPVAKCHNQIHAVHQSGVSFDHVVGGLFRCQSPGRDSNLWAFLIN
jgi:hypothetical protein